MKIRGRTVIIALSRVMTCLCGRARILASLANVEFLCVIRVFLFVVMLYALYAGVAIGVACAFVARLVRLKKGASDAFARNVTDAARVAGAKRR